MFLDPLRLWLLLVIINIAVGATAWIEIVLSLLIAAAMVTATTTTTSTVELIVPTASLTTHTTVVMPTTLIAISLVVVVGVELLLRPELLRLLGHVPSLSAADLAALWIEALDVVVVQLIALLRIK